MRKISFMVTLCALFAIVLIACASEAEPPAAATEPPAAATEPPAAATEPPVAATEPPATEAPAAVEHTDIPGNLPVYTGLHLYDHHINTTLGSIEGDRFYHAQLERPYNTDGVHFPALDITDVWYYDTDPMWFIAIISLVDKDANGALSGKYAIEVDLLGYDQDFGGYANWLFLVEAPSSTEWTTEGVQVWRDANDDVGGTDTIFPDTVGANGDGYEVLDDDDPDAAWVRLSSEHPNSLEIAFKKSLFGEGTKYMVAAWAGTEDLDPSLFDLNDRFTHEQAGALNHEYVDFYPIKEISEIDNTCRTAIGFDPTANVKGLCP